MNFSPKKFLAEVVGLFRGRHDSGQMLKEPRTLSGKTFMLTVANVISMAANSVTPFVLVRVLTQEEYGLWGKFVLLISTLHGVLNFNVNKSASYFIPRKEMTPGQVITGIMVFNNLVGAATFLFILCCPGPLLWMFKSGGLQPLFGIAGFVLLVWNFSRAMAVMPIALGRSAVSAVFIALTDSAKNLFILLPALLSPSLSTVIKGFVAWSVGRAALAGYYFFGTLKVRLADFNVRSLRRMLGYSLPFGLSGIVTMFAIKYDDFLAAHFFDEKAFAIYRVGVFELPFIILIMEAALDVVTPEISRLQSDHRHDEVIRLSARVCTKLATIFLPVFLFMNIMTEEFVTVAFTGKYIASSNILRVSLLEILLSLMVFDPIVRGYEQLKYLQLKLYGAALVVLLIFGKPVIQNFGAVGAVGFMLLLYFVNKCITFWRIKRLLPIQRRHLSHLADLKFIVRGGIVATLAAVAGKFFCPQLVAAMHREYTAIYQLGALAVTGIIFVAAYVVALEGGLKLDRTRDLLGLFKKRPAKPVPDEIYDQHVLEVESNPHEPPRDDKR